MRVLVDTCVWSRFLRKNRPRNDPGAAELERLIRIDAVQMLGPIRQELLSGAQPQERFAQLKEYLRFYPNVPLDEEDDENAGLYYNLVTASGLEYGGVSFSSAWGDYDRDGYLDLFISGCIITASIRSFVHEAGSAIADGHRRPGGTCLELDQAEPGT
jgi:predicted nucleic acid-binding protein